MYFNMVKNDLKKNKFSNLVVTAFMWLAVTLLISGVILSGQVWFSIQSLYDVAKPPHFLQMHKGDFEQAKIDEFNESFEGITDWQTVAMINIYGDEIIVHGKKESFTLADCSLDIGLVKQNESKDLLLNENREKIQLSAGEIALPVILKSTYDFSIGDTVTILENGIAKEFRVTDFVYDAQMNSTMCSSTRFLISDEDFEVLQGQIGEMEYIFEVYFENADMASDYQTAYESETLKMPKNGQAITYSMIFLLSALTDLIFAFLIFLVSVLIFIIAFVCMKYTLLASIQEELREIGTMKAIGIPHAAIRKLYLSKMKFLLFLGTVLGFFTAILVSNKVTTHMTDTFGKQQISGWTILAALLIGVLSYFLAVLFCAGIIRKTRNLNVVHTIVNGEGLKEGKYGLIFGVMLLVSVMVTLPVWLVHTMESKDFITYMGCGKSDILIEIPQGECLEEKNQTLMEFLSKEEINYEATRRIRLETMDLEGKKKSIHIDTGKHAGKGLSYLEGGCPENADEIALSKLEADMLGKQVGDMLRLSGEGYEVSLSICGIYQDVTSGGYTAKAILDFYKCPSEQYSYMINLEKKQDVSQVAEEFKKVLGNGYTILPMETFLSQTLGGVIIQIRGICNLVIFVALLLTAVITFLFMRLRLVREAPQIAIQKAIGLTSKKIQYKELKNLLWIAFLGDIAGNIGSILFGDDVTSFIFQILGLGIEKLQFTTELSAKIMVFPYLPFIAVVVIGMLALRKIKTIHIMEHLNVE